MSPFSSFSNAGVACIQAGIVNTSGVPLGITGALTAGTGAPLAVMKFAKQFGGQAPGPVRVTVVGDNNRNRHEYVFSAAQIGEMAFLFGALDLDAYAGFTGLKKATDGNGYSVLLQSNVAPMSAQACVVANIDAESADTATYGLKKWINQIYPLVNITPLLAQLREVAGADWSYQGIPTQAATLPWGVALSATTHGATKAAGYMLTSDYPIVIETLIATTAQTTYALAYTPATGTTYTVAWLHATGTLQTPTTSYAVSGKTVTMTTPAFGDTYVFRYEAVDLLSSN